jgi:serine/threonine protein kinase
MEKFLKQLNLHELEGYRYLRNLSGGEMAAVALYEAIDDLPSDLGPSMSESRAVEDTRGGRGISHDSKALRRPERVVVKFLIAPRWQLDLEAFRREAETLLMMRKHTGGHTIVKALTTVRSSEIYPVHYFMMEYVEGETFLSKFESRQGPWDVNTSLDYLRRIATALLPAAGFAEIHRDLHAGNIMIVEPTAMSRDNFVMVRDPGIRILDFGTSRNWLSTPQSSWQEDRFRHCGAVSAWSPEFLADPADVDSKHDIWALGTLFFRMITGEHAFPSENFKTYYDSACSGSYAKEALSEMPIEVRRLISGMFKVSSRERLSLAGVYKIANDILEYDLGNWLEAHPVLQELYFMVEGNIWKCPLCQAIGNPAQDGRCRSCKRVVEEFLLPF